MIIGMENMIAMHSSETHYSLIIHLNNNTNINVYHHHTSKSLMILITYG